MRIIRTWKPEIADLVRDLIVTDTPEDREKFTNDLRERLRVQDDNTCMYVAVADNKLVGFVILQNLPGPAVWLVQAWSKAGNEFTVIDELWLRAKLWAACLGKSTILAETARNTMTLFRRFGFEERKVLISYQLPTEILDNALESLRSVQNG